MRIKLIYLNLVIILIGFLVVSAFVMNDREGSEYSDNSERIKFSHQLHADAMSCADCHSSVISSTSLKDRLLPNHENCSVCHQVDNQDECGTCHIGDSYEPLIQKESALIFDHSFHSGNQKMECTSCHIGLDKVDYSFQAVQPNPPMENCYNCHSEKGMATNACEACHISTVNLIPQSHISSNFIKSHRFAANDIDANCVMCHDNNSCEECHVATNVIYEKNVSDDFYQPYYPSNYVDGAKQQAINRVHELNYRFTHSIDSKSKLSECQSCHQIETFCANCHQSDNNDFGISGIIPASHLKAGFITIGVGTGGGEHSVLARRDIERCISCHDVQGADPTCLQCHLDSDGIQGTNPKTHPSGFMKDENGDWHSSDASVCYNCHSSFSPSSPKGIGFCGYCHGS
ncbi:MAG: cytochrome C [Ignavibacteriaceae bacterium]|nr:cytochrome C [Ignavibacteriaceae bacterium]